MRIAAAFFGALFMVRGIAAQIEAARHRPQYSQIVIPGAGSTGIGTSTRLPATTYDLVRIGGWALLIFGAVIIAFALVREIRRGA